MLQHNDWIMNGGTIPQKKFEIVAENRQAQIINYDANKDSQWLFLQGFAKSAATGQTQGLLRLYSVTHQKYQPKMNAQCWCFAHLKLHFRDATLFCFTKPDGMGTKLHIVEVSTRDKASLLKVQADLRLKNQNDFIVSMVPGDKFILLFIHCYTTYMSKCNIFYNNCATDGIQCINKRKHELGLRGISKSTIKSS